MNVFFQFMNCHGKFFCYFFIMEIILGIGLGKTVIHKKVLAREQMLFSDG